MLGVFQIGEVPSRPLTIDVSGSAGLLDLSDYSAVTIEATPALPAHVITTADPGRVQLDFTAPFTLAGEYEFRIKLTTAGGRVDYTPYIPFAVTDETTEAILSTDDAYRITAGGTVTTEQLLKAQQLVALVLDRDITDEGWLSRISTDDTRRLKAAIAFWAADPSHLLLSYPSNVSSISTGDQSVSFFNTSYGDSVAVPVKAALALRRLSWMRTPRTIHTRPAKHNWRGYDSACEPALEPGVVWWPEDRRTLDGILPAYETYILESTPSMPGDE